MNACICKYSFCSSWNPISRQSVDRCCDGPVCRIFAWTERPARGKSRVSGWARVKNAVRRYVNKWPVDRWSPRNVHMVKQSRTSHMTWCWHPESLWFRQAASGWCKYETEQARLCVHQICINCIFMFRIRVCLDLELLIFFIEFHRTCPNSGVGHFLTILRSWKPAFGKQIQAWNILGDNDSGYILTEGEGNVNCLQRHGEKAKVGPCDAGYAGLSLQFASKEDISLMMSPGAR